MSKTYRTFREIREDITQCEWRWDGEKMEFRAKYSKAYKEWTLSPATSLDDLGGDATIIETTSLHDLQDLQNWLICLDDNDSSTLIGTLVHKIESTPEMTITQFVSALKTLTTQTI